MNEFLFFAVAFWITIGLLIGAFVGWIGSIIYKEFRNDRPKR